MDLFLEVLIQVSPATPQQADPVSSTPIVLPKLLSPRSELRLMLRGFQTSRSQDRPPGAEQVSNAAVRPLPDGEL